MPNAHPGSPVDSSNAISTPTVIQIRSLALGDDATAFRSLNEEWITRTPPRLICPTTLMPDQHIGSEY
jgi:hypothetical protein